MLTDAATIKFLAKYYAAELPADGIKFTISLLSRGKFSSEYKAGCILNILYLDDLLKREHITAEGWNTIHCGLESKADTAYESMQLIS